MSSVVERSVADRLRLSRFLTVGLFGFLVQIAALAALTSLADWTWLPATLVSVELAVIHNFLWHERWTWIDRTPGRSASSAWFARLLRFHVSNGLISIAGNAALMSWLVGVLAMPAVPANALAVGAMSVLNFVMADRWVFRGDQSLPRMTRETRRSIFLNRYGLTSVSSVVKICLAALLAMPITTFAAPPPALLGPYDQPQTVAAWERYVAATEARLERSATPAPRASDAIAATGESIHVPSGTISDWRGAVFIPNLTIDRLLHGLQHPGTPPPQEDVVSSRVIARGADSLRVGIRLVRHAIVTVSYDTEHEMRFRRLTPTLATARSVATRIEQVDGGDHGFLWRLHSYWRYEDTGGGVLVELRSLTLSRNVPALVRPIAGPLVTRVARESMVRTLEALRQYFGAGKEAVKKSL
jgi:putative flippase GtrA